MLELTIEREESNLKELEFSSTMLLPAIFSISSWLYFDRFLLLVETLRRHMICSPADIAKSSISLMARGFGFKRGRLKRFERRRVYMGRRIKMMGFLNFFPLGFLKLRLGLSSTKLTLAFSSDLSLKICLLIFYENHF